MPISLIPAQLRPKRRRFFMQRFFEWLPFRIHSAIIKGLSGPFVWANRRKKQTPVTRAIRALWRAL